MKYNLPLLTLVLFCTSLFSQKIFTVEDICGSSKFQVETWAVTAWRPCHHRFTYYKKVNGIHSIFHINPETGEKYLLIDSDMVPILEGPKAENRFILPNYLWSPQGKSLLIPASQDLFIYNPQSKEINRLTHDNKPEIDPVFSPDGKWLAYIKNDNLTCLNLKSLKETALTRHGNGTRLIGQVDWVYEEEFKICSAFAWSPDSRHIAFYELDTSPEPVHPLVYYSGIRDSVIWQRYPLAGESNAIVRIGVINLKNRQTAWMDIGKNPDVYIPRFQWLPDGRTLAIQRLNREQNRLDLIFSDISTGRSFIVLSETDPEGWIDIYDNPVFLKKEEGFIWISERDNWTHLYYFDYHKRGIRQLTAGNWEVTKLVHVDEDAEWIYFTATRQSPLERQFYRVRLDGNELTQLSRRNGSHDVSMSPDGLYYVDTFSDITTPPQITLHHADGSLIAVLSSGDIPALRDYQLALPELITLTMSDGLSLNAMLMKPANFSPHHKYPVLVFAYSCPERQIVLNNWQRGQGNLWHQLLSQRGYCIFSMDSRGTVHRGNAFKNQVYRNIGRAFQDQIEAVQQLRDQDYVDPDRIGMWGWSGGGWMTCLAMTKGADYFKTGIAVAPLTDLQNYDTIWTERYMGKLEDNPEGYKESSPIHFTDQYQGGLLLIHGTCDDNVHVSNTLQFACAMQTQSKPFGLMIYPDKDHNIGGRSTRVHLYHLMTRFILENL
ncbi:S9 family peptidase [bacterium]|nr:S9 family peptidase [bacterium]